MVKLVVLSSGMAGRTHELNVEKTTIGRLEDNTLPIAEPSVSSHHCEIIVQGSDVKVKDLNSTNGTFVNGEKVSEATLKHGQVLRLGQVELRLESDAPGSAPLPPATPSPASAAPQAAPSRKLQDQTTVIRGVKLDELDSGSRTLGFGTGKGFSKKEDKVNKIFLFGGIGVGIVILGLLIWVFITMSQ